jgi:hypothetical protein
MPRYSNPIIEASDRLFGDTSVSRSVTHARLTEAVDHLEMLLSTLGDVPDEEGPDEGEG